jgi:tetratricopeptide (TPR) repeat protein
MKQFTLIFSLLAFAWTSHAQIATPDASPTAKIEQNLGLGKVMIEYSRPSLKDRTAFAAEGEKSIEKYGKVWRTGANSATKITFSEDIKIDGKNLKAGSYSILSYPGEKEWEVRFFNYDSPSWNGYAEKTAVLVTKVPAKKLGRQVETFTIDINNIRNASASMDLMWGDMLVSIPMTLGTDKKVVDSITKVMAGPGQGDYHQAASYYLTEGKDLPQALIWIRKANESDQKFWMVRTEALILAEMGRYEDAIEKAKESRSLAEKAQYEPYIRNNNESIEEWTAAMNENRTPRPKMEKAKSSSSKSK